MKHLNFVAFKGKSWVSKAIRYFTRSKDYSHIAVLLDDCNLIEAWKGRTHRSFFSEHTKDTIYEIWSLGVPDNVHYHCMKYYQHPATVQTPYDYFGIAGFILKKTVKQSKKRLFCSELAMTPLSSAMCWGKIVPSHISPESFVDIIQAAGGHFKRGVI